MKKHGEQISLFDDKKPEHAGASPFARYKHDIKNRMDCFLGELSFEMPPSVYLKLREYAFNKKDIWREQIIEKINELFNN
jgi:hypothetical protein